jgi:hypothetical protein
MSDLGQQMRNRYKTCDRLYATGSRRQQPAYGLRNVGLKMSAIYLFIFNVSHVTAHRAMRPHKKRKIRVERQMALYPGHAADHKSPVPLNTCNAKNYVKVI